MDSWRLVLQQPDKVLLTTALGLPALTVRSVSRSQRLLSAPTSTTATALAQGLKIVPVSPAAVLVPVTTPEMTPPMLPAITLPLVPLLASTSDVTSSTAGKTDQKPLACVVCAFKLVGMALLCCDIVKSQISMKQVCVTALRVLLLLQFERQPSTRKCSAYIYVAAKQMIASLFVHSMSLSLCMLCHDSLLCCDVGAPMLGCWQSKPLASPPTNHTSAVATPVTRQATMTPPNPNETTATTDISDRSANEAIPVQETDLTTAPRQSSELNFFLQDLAAMSERRLMAILESLTDDRTNTSSRMELFGTVVHLLQQQHRISM